MDDNNDKAISYQEFSKAMRDYKCDLSEEETNVVFQEVDRDGNGSLSIDELVRAIQVFFIKFTKLGFECLQLLGRNERVQKGHHKHCVQ